MGWWSCCRIDLAALTLSDTERPEKVGSTHPAHRGNRISHKGEGKRQVAAAARSRIAANPGLSQHRQIPSIARKCDAFQGACG
jgi:hypothetical protein